MKIITDQKGNYCFKSENGFSAAEVDEIFNILLGITSKK